VTWVTITELILVRHGESEGNVAREAAEAEQADEILIDRRDPDVALSSRGRSQAEAVGRWLGDLAAEARPGVAWTSPYTRARQTADLALDTAALRLPLHIDERLRDRELGILDRLTSRGVTARYPDEARRRRYLGKMYYRPPGGESWADMALRLRSFLADLDLDRAHEAGCGLVVCHDAVILVLRYILEELTEKQVLDIAAGQSLGNGSVTRLARPERKGPWQTVAFNVQDHLTAYGSEPTSHEAEQDVHPR
jgi:broad specificity phosphatase PhoE